VKLIGVGNNAKTIKSDMGGEYTTGIMYLAPHKLSGQNFCASASPGCISACLYTAGRGAMKNVQEARLKKSKLFIEDRKNFFIILQEDINKLNKLCKKNGTYPAIRLNGTSDLQWEQISDIIKDNPDIQFYDYTKHYKRMLKYIEGELPVNYHLTFSRSESNWKKCLDVLAAGGNVTAVFRDKLPTKFENYFVIDGDTHDLRFLDRQNVIVGLKAKGQGKNDRSGFVI
jgi:hypothetical protein